MIIPICLYRNGSNNCKLKMSRRRERIPKRKRDIGSLDDLRQHTQEIFEVVNSNDRLALLAAANPMMVLEEMGYTFTEEFQKRLERIFRFSREDMERLDSLERQVFEHAGKRFNIDSPRELSRVLFEDLKLPEIKKTVKEQIDSPILSSKLSELPTEQITPKVSWGPKVSDPLEELKDAHPIIEPLLEYRRIEASHTRLAKREVYEKIKSGEVKLPIKRVRFRLRSIPT